MNQNLQDDELNINYYLHSEQLNIPVLDGFNTEKPLDPQVILLARKSGFLNQIISDGPLGLNETFEQRINLVNKNILNFMKRQSLDNNDNSIFFYKDFSNKDFNFKIYVQDMVINVNEDKKVFRQLNAFFLEQRFNDFYQVSLTIGPFNMPLEILKLGSVDLEKDYLTKNTLEIFENQLSNLTYKNEEQIKKQNIENIFSTNDENSIIHNEYDYSNILPTIECISYLVEYCANVYQEFLKLIEIDEEKNKQFKTEYKEYNYKKSYGDSFEVKVWKKSVNNVTCNDLNSFKSLAIANKLDNINELDINLNLDFKRGKGIDLEEHKNSFNLIFKPYKILFMRNSNHNDVNMNEIESNIKEILKKFPVANSIFCTK